MADTDFDRALRYRKMAEQTRIAAGAAITESAREWLVKLASDYDVLAAMYESKCGKQGAQSPDQ
jgi:hypothetical protein